MTADTFTNDGVGLLLMGTGNDNNIWGSNQNTNIFQIVADALANVLTEAVTGGTLDLSGTPPPNASSQVHYAGIIFTGVLLSNQIFIVPNLNKWWFVKNATSGAFTLVFKTTSGSSSSVIPQNSGWQMIQCDGANNIVVHPYNTVAQLMPDGTTAAPSHSWVNERNSGWRRAGSQDYRYVVNGVDVLQVAAGGVNVLSGTLAAGAVTAASLAASGAVSGATLAASGAITGGSVSATGQVSGASASITGNAAVGSMSATNASTVSGRPITSFNSGTIMLFRSSSSPTAWTKDFTFNDRALRVTNSTIGQGGSQTFSTVFGRTDTDNHAITTSEMPSHNHGVNDPGHFHQLGEDSGAATSPGSGNLRNAGFVGRNTNSSGTNISINNAGSDVGHSHPMDIRVNYVDVIFASKD